MTLLVEISFLGKRGPESLELLARARDEMSSLVPLVQAVWIPCLQRLVGLESDHVVGEPEHAPEQTLLGACEHPRFYAGAAQSRIFLEEKWTYETQSRGRNICFELFSEFWV